MRPYSNRIDGGHFEAVRKVNTNYTEYLFDELIVVLAICFPQSYANPFEYNIRDHYCKRLEAGDNS